MSCPVQRVKSLLGRIRTRARSTASRLLQTKEYIRQCYFHPEYRFYRAYHQFVADRAEDKRLDYSLNKNSVVFDIGGYRGDWAAAIYERYGATVHVFEPVTSFFDGMKTRFRDTPQIVCHHCGVGAVAAKVAISLEADASSLHKVGAKQEEIKICAVDDVLREIGVQKIDLVKINIEGEEFPLLERLVETGEIKRFQDIQVQFHTFVPNARARYAKLCAELEKTHERVWHYHFVWENWRLVSRSKTL